MKILSLPFPYSLHSTLSYSLIPIQSTLHSQLQSHSHTVYTPLSATVSFPYSLHSTLNYSLIPIRSTLHSQLQSHSHTAYTPLSATVSFPYSLHSTLSYNLIPSHVGIHLICYTSISDPMTHHICSHDLFHLTIVSLSRQVKIFLKIKYPKVPSKVFVINTHVKLAHVHNATPHCVFHSLSYSKICRITFSLPAHSLSRVWKTRIRPLMGSLSEGLTKAVPTT